MEIDSAPPAVPSLQVGLQEQCSNTAAASSTINRTPVTVTPLAVPGASGGPPPPCHLLEMGGVTILLDVGLDGSLDVSSLEPLRAVAPRVDALLVSHADLAHIGGLPYAFQALGLDCPVYATLPVVKLGQMTLYDAHENARLRPVGGPPPFDLDDVDAAFRRCVELKYSQQVGGIVPEESRGGDGGKGRGRSGKGGSSSIRGRWCSAFPLPPARARRGALTSRFPCPPSLPPTP